MHTKKNIGILDPAFVAMLILIGFFALRGGR